MTDGHSVEILPVNHCDQCGNKLDKNTAVGEFNLSRCHIFIQCTKCGVWTEWMHQTGTISPEYLQEYREKYGF